MMAVRLTQPDAPEAAAERRAVADGRLPPRYGTPWHEPFLDRVGGALVPGARVLDVGSGARPVVGPSERPPGLHYVGLDISARELERAPPGAYDEVVVADISSPQPTLERRFDLVISWQTLEHVPSMRGALDSQQRALVPGGRMVAMLTGAWSIQALVARLVPDRISRIALARLLGVDPADKFPTRYDACSLRAVSSLLAAGGWREWEITPFYKAAAYLSFAPGLQRAYLRYENWAAAGPRAALATHLLLDARR